MITPPYLQQGDKIAIIAPAKRVTREEIAPAIEILQSWHLEVVEGNYLYAQNGYYAGSDLERLSDLQLMLDNPEIKAIICARGGYGTTRLLDRVIWHNFRHCPKWLIGFSDITALHTHLLANLDTSSIHGPMALNFATKEAFHALEHLRKILFAENTHLNLPAHELNKPDAASGLLIGGNLSLLTNIIGTSSDIKYRQHILLLEEVEEYYYRIDRMMIHLLRTGKLEYLSAVVIGQFTDMMDNQIPFGKSAYQIINDILAPFDFPVFFNAPFGHISKNYAFPHGVPGTIENIDGQWQLSWKLP